MRRPQLLCALMACLAVPCLAAPGAGTYGECQDVIAGVAAITYWRYVDVLMGGLWLKPCGKVYAEGEKPDGPGRYPEHVW